MDKDQLTYIIALQHVPLVGPIHAKNLIAWCGSPEGVFSEKKTHLKKIPGIGDKIAQSISHFTDFEIAVKEIEFIDKHHIKPLFYLDEAYPARLKDLEDAPILLYYKGKADLNASKVLAVVGTRRATPQGRKICERIIEDLKDFNVTIVSGLAYGIDYCAHKSSVKNNVPTVGVLAHGLDTIYPPEHRNLAVSMLELGGLITEHPSGVLPAKMNFPERNRIVAGMSDAVLVIESGKKGGALITAEIAYSYNREVMVVPGRPCDEMSSGCNHYIKINKACLVENASDIAYQMGWDIKPVVKKKSVLDLSNFTEAEVKIISLLRLSDKTNIDKLSNGSGLSHTELSLLLLDLEFRGIIIALPGSFYKLFN